MYREVLTKQKSVDTCFLKHTLPSIDFDYPVLDLGGGHHWSYHRYIGTDHSKTISTNLPRAENIDVAMDAEAQFPFESGTFSTVFAFNLLEHLYDYSNAVEETYRVLEQGRKFLFSIPFIHRIHGDPNDYHRLTDEAIKRMLSDFSTVNIHSHSRGPVSTGQQMMVPLNSHPVVSYLSWRVANLMDDIFNRFGLYADDTVEKFPLYYIVEATK
jgi:SAM-dependent methyltransferase